MLFSRGIPIIKTKSLPFRGALLSSGVMAFAGLGDALLYPLLPIYGESLGFSGFFIGVLLAVNRFVRVLANTPIANLVNTLGMKMVLVVSSTLAVLTTLFYGLGLGAISFLIARMVWGLSYSGLKIVSLNYAAAARDKSGLAFGFSKGIKTVGAFFSLYVGPIFVDSLGIENGLFMVALISSVGIVLALMLPYRDTRPKGAKVETKKTFSPSPINLLVFIHSIAIDGIVVVVLSSLLRGDNPDSGQLLITVSFYLLLKRLFVLVFSFVGGFLTLRIPAIKLFNLSVALCISGTLLIALGYTVIGIVLSFLFNTFIVTFSPLIALQRQSGNENSLQAISGISTWWDLGAAVGAFVGIYLIELTGPLYLFLILAFLMMVLYLNFITQNARTNRTII